VTQSKVKHFHIRFYSLNSVHHAHVNCEKWKANRTYRQKLYTLQIIKKILNMSALQGSNKGQSFLKPQLGRYV